jgi:hypothetical protein
MYNSYANAVRYIDIEVMSGLKKRTSKLISDDNDASADSFSWLSPLVLPDGSIHQSSETLEQPAVEKIAAQSSLILVLVRGGLQAKI